MPEEDLCSQGQSQLLRKVGQIQACILLKSSVLIYREANSKHFTIKYFFALKRDMKLRREVHIFQGSKGCAMDEMKEQ